MGVSHKHAHSTWHLLSCSTITSLEYDRQFTSPGWDVESGANGGHHDSST